MRSNAPPTGAPNNAPQDAPLILLIEDEDAIAQTVIYALEREGFAVSHRRLGREGVALFQERGASLVLLDIGLPDGNGFDVCKTLHAVAAVPVIFLTARSDEVDRVVGLELGGDDYITKPFSPRELVARVRAVLRRAAPAMHCGEPTASNAEAEKDEETPARMGPFTIDRLRHAVSYQNVALSLTKYEYLLLCCLLQSPGQVLSRGQIMEQAWRSADTSLERSVDTHVKSLRAKLKQVDASQEVIVTHRGFGYSLELAP